MAGGEDAGALVLGGQRGAALDDLDVAEAGHRADSERGAGEDGGGDGGGVAAVGVGDELGVADVAGELEHMAGHEDPAVDDVALADGGGVRVADGYVCGGHQALLTGGVSASLL